MKKLVSVALTLTVIAFAWAARDDTPRRDTRQVFEPTTRFEEREAPVATALPGTDAHLTVETKLLAEDGAPGDAFGFAVALDDDTVLVGAFLNAAAGVASGSAYVFRRGDDNGWTQEAKLVAGDAEPFDFFGISASLDDDRALIGAYQDDDNGLESGSAYIFERTATGDADWSETFKLIASDGAIADLFGNAVAVDGDLAVVGAPLADAPREDSGAAYVYRFDGSTWNEEAKLVASDGPVAQTFGSSVAVGGDVIVVGAPLDDDEGANAGSAYVFRYDGTSWGQEAKLTASDGDAGMQFGLSVSIDGGTVVVATDFAPGRSVYVFGPGDGGWSEEQKLTVDTGIGFAVSVAGDTIAAGAYLDGDGATGAAYVFGRTDGTWIQDQKLTAGDAEIGDRFGIAVSTDGVAVAVGADTDDDNGDNAGAVYVYEQDGTAQPPVADAGADSASECVSVEGSLVRLDGSGSTDPGGSTDAILLYEWFEDFELPSETLLGEGEIVDVILPLGEHDVTLRVTNASMLDDTDDVVAAVVDTTAPEISMRVSPAVLWPPNHGMVQVGATVEATDACGAPSVVLVSVVSSEPDNAPGGGDGNTVNDIQGAEPGTADFEVFLRAERSGSGDGRAYTLAYTATDTSGNDASAGAEVRVPKSQGGKNSGNPRTVKRGR